MPTVAAITPNARYPRYQATGGELRGCLMQLARLLHQDGITDFRGPFLVDYTEGQCGCCGHMSASEILTPLGDTGAISKVEGR